MATNPPWMNDAVPVGPNPPWMADAVPIGEPAPAPKPGPSLLSEAADWLAPKIGDFAHLEENARKGAFTQAAGQDEGLWDRTKKAYYRGGAGMATGFLRLLEGAGSDKAKQIADTIQQGITNVPIAGQTEWSDLKAHPNLSNLGGFLAGATAESAPSLATALIPYVGLPALAASGTGNIAEQRAQNNGRQNITSSDVYAAAPAGIASAWLQRLGVEGVGGDVMSKLGLGKAAFEFADNPLSRITQAMTREGLAQGAQSGVNYGGGTIGTNKGFSPSEALDQVLSGTVMGAGLGGATRGGIEAGGLFMPTRAAPAGPAAGEGMESGSFNDFAGPGGAGGVPPRDANYVHGLLPAPRGTTGEPGAELLRLPPPDWMRDAVPHEGPLALPKPSWMADAIPEPGPAKLEPPVAYADTLGDTGIGASGLSDLAGTSALRRVEAGRPEGNAVTENYLRQVRGAESGVDDANARNPRSSATGRYQFTDGTWLNYYKRRYGADGLSDNQILAKRSNGAIQDQLMRDLTRDNANALQAVGAPVTEGNLYLAHFAGAGGAAKLLHADPSAPVENVLGRAVVKANPFLQGKTAGETVAWAARKMGSSPEASMLAGAGAEDQVTVPMPAMDTSAPDFTTGGEQANAPQGEAWRIARRDATLERQTALPAERAPIADVPAERTGSASQVVTPRGRAVDTQFEVRPLSEITDSSHAQFDQALQPRERGTRAASDAQIASIAGNLDPQQLADSRTASTGAPIIGPDGQVESGNGRIAAIRRVYEGDPAKAAAYRAMIQSQGLDTTGIDQPVLVRRRITPMTPTERASWVSEANERTAMALSSPEQAASDARAIPSSTLALYRGGPVTAAGNRDFVREFMQRAVSPADRNAMMGPDGTLSADGVRRVRMALLARAYGDPDLISRIAEDSDTNIAGIGKALLDAAPAFARLRGMIEEGHAPQEYDIAPDIADAARMVARSRDTGQSVKGMIAQADAFRAGTTPETEGVLHLFYRDPDLRQPRSAPKIADGLTFYADEAQRAAETSANGPDMFGGQRSTSPAAILQAAQARLDGREAAQGGLFEGEPRQTPETAPAAPTAPTEAPARTARVEEIDNGKNVAVHNASPEVLDAITKAVPTAKGKPRDDGAMVYPGKHYMAIHSAVQLHEAHKAAAARAHLRRPLEGPAPTNMDEAKATLQQLAQGPAIDNYDSTRNHASHVLSILDDRGPEAAAKMAASTLEQNHRLNENERRAFEIVRDNGNAPAAPVIEPPARPAEPAPAPQPRATAPANRIEDFGEKLEGARKDTWQGWRERMSDASDIDPTEAPLSQSWPEPDYQKLADDGADPYVVAAIRAMRDAIPNRPRRLGLASWGRATEKLRDTANAILHDEAAASRFVNALEGNRQLGDIRGLIDLYQTFGHEKSFKGLSFGEQHFGLYKGEKNVTKWIVSQKAKANAYSNWPRELAVGDTREEALAKFGALLKSGELDAKRQARGGPRFEIYSYRSVPGKFHIGVKIGRNTADLKTFDTVKEARDFLGSEAGKAELTKAFEDYKNVPEHRKETNSPRVGEDYRHGADVGPEQFSDTFGFRGVQFGNYVEGAKRQADLNQAYDALTDLAGILNVPAQALSLNGELGLAFGARGRGGKSAAAAHYEPDRVVINLTKHAGAGSLAHEWWHSLDNYFARQRGDKGSEFVTRTLTRPGSLRPEMAAAFQSLMKALKLTALKERSRRLDKRRTKEYWSTDIEMSARAFESYVIAKLEEQNGSNDYLANIVPEKAYERENEYPYLKAAEIPAVRAAFDDFFKAIETEKTPAGVRMYSVPEEGTVAHVSERLAEMDRQFPTNEEYGVSSPNGGARVGRIETARREAARQLDHMGQLDKYWDDLLAWEGGPAKFGDVRIERGHPDQLDAQGMRRYSVPEAGDEAPAINFDDVQADLSDRLKRMGLDDKVWLDVVDGLGASGLQGRFLPYSKVIQVALDAVNEHSFVLHHEAVHALRELGAFSAADWKMLRDATHKVSGLRASIARRYDGFDADAMDEEAVADMFAMHQAGKIKAPTGIAALFAKLGQFLTALRNSFAGKGFTSRNWRTVMDEMASGKLSERIGRNRARTNVISRASVPEEGTAGEGERLPAGRHYIEAAKRSETAEAMAERLGITPLQARYRIKAREQILRDNPRLARNFAGAKESRADEDPVARATSAIFEDDANPADLARKFADVAKNPLKTAKAVLKGLDRFASTTMYSSDGALRTLDRHYNAPSISKLADMFQSRHGLDEGTGETYDEALKRENGRFRSQLTDAVTPHLDNPASLGRIRDMLTNPDKKLEATRSEFEAAKKLRSLLDDIHAYRVKAGEDLGDVTNYFPRVMDAQAVARDPDKFVAAAEELFRDKGSANPRRAAEWWMRHILDTDAGLDGGRDFVQPSGKPNSSKSRSFGPEADAVLRDFMLKNPLLVLSDYITGSVRKAEQSRRFGPKGAVGSKERAAWEAKHGTDSQWDALVEQIRDELRASGEDAHGVIDRVKYIRDAMLGRLNSTVKTSRRVAAIHAWNQLALLQRVTLSSLGDAAMGFFDGPGYGMRHLGITVKEAARQIKAFGEREPSDAYRWAEAAGTVGHGTASALIQARLDVNPGAMPHAMLLNKFYHKVGIEQWTQGGRIAATQNAKIFLGTLADDLVSKSDNTRKRARYYLKELGIKDPDAFGEWVRDNGTPGREAVQKADDPRVAQYVAAVVRFADRTVLMPTRAHKPAWASHPLGSLIFALQSYNAAFTQNVLKRVGRLGAQAFKSKDPRFLMPIGGLAAIIAANALQMELRAYLFGSGKKPDSLTEFGIDVLDRAGLTGMASPLYNAIFGVKYRRSFGQSLAGSVLGRGIEAADTLGNLLINNSPNTNTAERKAAGLVFDMAIDPAVNAFGANYLKGPLGTAVIMGGGNRPGGVLPSDREAFVTAVAGPQNAKGKLKLSGFGPGKKLKVKL